MTLFFGEKRFVTGGIFQPAKAGMPFVFLQEQVLQA